MTRTNRERITFLFFFFKFYLRQSDAPLSFEAEAGSHT